MARDLPTDLEAAIEAPVVRPFLAIRIETPDPVYVFTGAGSLIFDDADGNSRTWIGAGEVGAIDTIGESTDGSATGIKCTLFKIPSEFRDDLADQAVRGVTFELYAGALNETFQTVEATALIWKGRLDDYKITDAGTTLSVEVSGESRAIDQRRPSIKRFTDEYQQRKYPGDLFFQYVSRMTEVSILWAQAEQSSISMGSGGEAGGSACPTLDTLILMADGSQKPAGEVVVGDIVRTRHENSLEWGDYRVAAAQVAQGEPVYRVIIDGCLLRATAGHRIWVDGEWRRMVDLGDPDGAADVAKITIEDAHTYISNGLLSHNVKTAV